jgi:hypothetical protein
MFIATINLWDPAMTTYHQAGVGGLAATIQAWEEMGKTVPGLSWKVTDETIELRWESKPALVQFIHESIRVENDFVVLRAFETAGDAYSDVVRYAHTSALRMTLLQNGRTVTSKSGIKFKNLGGEYDRVFSCKSLEDFQTRSVFSVKGDWSEFPRKGYLYPGSAIEDSASKCGREPLDRTLACVFAIVGVVPFLIHRSSKAYQAGIAVPQVTGLHEFARRRHRLLSGIKKWHASGPEDMAARLFPELYLDNKVDQLSVKLPHCPPIEVMVFGKAPDDKQQKNVTRLVTVAPPTEDVLRRIEIVAQRLSATPTLDKSVKDREAYTSVFRISEWRRILTENIVAGRPLFHGTRRAFSDVDMRTFDLTYWRNVQGLRQVFQDLRSEKLMSDVNQRFVDMVSMCLYYWRGWVASKGRHATEETNLLIHSTCNCLSQQKFRRVFRDFVYRSSQARQPASGYLDCIRWAQGLDWKEAADLFVATLVSYDKAYTFKLLTDRGFDPKPAETAATEAASNDVADAVDYAAE